MFGVSEALWKFPSRRSVSMLMMAAQRVPPEGQDRGVMAGSGVFGMVDGVIWFNMRVSNCIVGNRSPWRGHSRGNGDPKLVADLDVVVTAPWPGAARACE